MRLGRRRRPALRACVCQPAPAQKLCQPGPKFAAMAAAFLATSPTRTTAGEREDFRGGEDVLHRRAELHAEGVEQREQGDDDDGGEVRGVQADVHVAEDHGADGDCGDVRDVPEPVVGADGGEEDAEEFSEGDADRRDGPGLDDEEERPAVEEAPERAERLAQIDVLAAGAWASWRPARRS